MVPTRLRLCAELHLNNHGPESRKYKVVPIYTGMGLKNTKLSFSILLQLLLRLSHAQIFFFGKILFLNNL